jgi:hypothetical protein
MFKLPLLKLVSLKKQHPKSPWLNSHRHIAIFKWGIPHVAPAPRFSGEQALNKPTNHKSTPGIRLNMTDKKYGSWNSNIHSNDCG